MVRVVPIPPKECTIIDLGSGKGRALFFAARHGFRRVIGVEFSEYMHGIAVSNSANFSARETQVPRTELVRGDAATFDFLDEPLLIYMFNPFDGAVMESVVARIAAHAARSASPVYVVHKTPKCAAMFSNHGAFETVLVQKAGRKWLRAVENFVVYRVVGNRKSPA